MEVNIMVAEDCEFRSQKEAAAAAAFNAPERVSADVETETDERVKERIRRELTSLIMVCCKGMHNLYISYLGRNTLMRALVSEAKAERYPNAYQSSLEYADSLGTESHKRFRAAFQWERKWIDDTQEHDPSVSNPYNRLLGYETIFLSMLACADSDGTIQELLDSYNQEVLDSFPDPHGEISRTEYLTAAHNLIDLIRKIRETGVFAGKSILEIGGHGLEEAMAEGKLAVCGQPEKFVALSARANEHNSGDEVSEQTSDHGQHITTANFAQLIGSEPFDFTVTRGVFDSGSGVKGSFGSEEEAVDDLLHVLALTTKAGGFSLHEGNMPPPDQKTLRSLGFELVLEVERVMTDGYMINPEKEEIEALVDHQATINVKSDDKRYPETVFSSQPGRIRTRQFFDDPYRYVWILRKI